MPDLHPGIEGPQAGASKNTPLNLEENRTRLLNWVMLKA